MLAAAPFVLSSLSDSLWVQLSRDRSAAIDDQRVAGNKGAGFAREELKRRGDILGPADATDRLGARRSDKAFGAKRIDLVKRLRRFNYPGRNGVDRYSGGAEFGS
jgi:hypothetical protein